MCHMTYHICQCLLCVRQGEEMVEIHPSLPTPGEVLGDQRWFETMHQRLEASQMALVKRVSTSQREPHAMHGERVVRAQARERSEARAAAHVVLGVHLQPTDGRMRLQDFRHVRRPEANPHPAPWNRTVITHG